MRKNVFYLFLGLLLGLYACGDKDRLAIDTSNIKAKVKIRRMEQEIFALKSPDKIRDFLKKESEFSQKYLQIERFPNDSIIVNGIYKMVTNPYLDTVYNDVQKHYQEAEIKVLEQEFEVAFKRIKYHFSDFKVPKVYTIITGLKSFFGYDFFVTKDLIVISLDFFLGESARYRPPVEEVPNYIWQRYHKGAIVRNCVRDISSYYNKTDMLDKSLIAEMIYYGKAYEFMHQIMPNLPDSVLTGYSAEDMANVRDKENINYIWAYFLDKNLLYSTRSIDKQSFLNERPYVGEISRKCPGRIGRWLGWRIVQRYLEKHPEVSLAELMKMEDARKLFNDSGYKGEF